MRAAEHRVALDSGRNGDGAAHAGVGPLGVVDDFLRRRVQRPVVVGFHPNSNPIACHIFLFPARLTAQASTTPPSAGGENLVRFFPVSSARDPNSHPPGRALVYWYAGVAAKVRVTGIALAS